MLSTLTRKGALARSLIELSVGALHEMSEDQGFLSHDTRSHFMMAIIVIGPFPRLRFLAHEKAIKTLSRQVELRPVGSVGPYVGSVWFRLVLVTHRSP